MRKKEESNFPDWIQKSLKVLKPPERITVSKWADKNRILDSKTSASPGQWKTSTTPYLKGIMDAFNDKEIETIVFCKPTQVGGTESLNNMLGYVISQEPAPTLIVYPTLELAKYTSKNRLQPMIRLSDSMNEKFIESETKELELQFDGMYVVISGANSPASLASRPIRYLFLDEVDKYPSNAGKESDPISLAKERTKTFKTNRKIFITSTPTLKVAPIWQALQTSDEERHYFVPCPHCGAYQELKFKQIKWQKNEDKSLAADSAYYECEHCKEKIRDSHKMQMLRNGKWEAVRSSGSKKTVGFHLNTIYSPWVDFSEVVYEFLKSKENPEMLQNFVNSWLAEPWEETQLTVNSDTVMEKQSEYNVNVVPDQAQVLTAGVDVQQNKLYYTIRAWGANYTSWNIAHGEVYDFESLELVMNTEYLKRNGQKYQVELCLMDSGYRTDEVYEFCYFNADWCIPAKGSSDYNMFAKYRLSVVNKTNSKAMGMRLVNVNTNKYKDFIASRLRRKMPEDKLNGSFMVHADCDIDYAQQITSEHKVKEKKGENEVMIWRPKRAHIDNHYLDCEVYASCAGDLVNVIALQEGDEIITSVQPKKKENNNSGWFGGGSNNSGGWL